MSRDMLPGSDVHPLHTYTICPHPLLHSSLLGLDFHAFSLEVSLHPVCGHQESLRITVKGDKGTHVSGLHHFTEEP